MRDLHFPSSAIRKRLSAALGLVTVAALSAAGLSAVGAAPNEPGDRTRSEELIRVIVQMDGEAALAAAGENYVEAGREPSQIPEVADRRAALKKDHRAAVNAMRDSGVEVRHNHDFTDLINGMSLEVAETDIAQLENLPGVTSVVPAQRMRTSTDVSVPLIGAPEVWEQSDGSGAAVKGDGVTIAVIDTGIDYEHPSLGGGLGADYKVVGGYDYVNDDEDPMDDNGHGTHVAGIVAGDGDVSGVAPAASLTAYKVLNADGLGWEDDIIAAIEAAADPTNPNRADVINMSLGGPGDGTDPVGRAATAAAEAGVVVVASAGNAGPGQHTVGSPGLADGVLAVGASASGISLPTARMVSPRDEPLQTFRAPYSASPPAEPLTGEVVDVHDGTDADYDEAGDISGKVVAINSNLPPALEYVSPYYLEQARKAEERGAIAMIAYTGGSGGPVLSLGDEVEAFTEQTEDGVVDVPLTSAESGDSFRMDKIVVLGLKDLEWERLGRDLEEGTVEVTIAGEDVTDQIASFSSRGPTPEYQLKPDIVAPGVEIRSTWPTKQWKPGVYRLSGTSMAAPHAAGAAALLRQSHPDANAGDLRDRLIGSASALSDVAPLTGGAGRLDVSAAVNASITASPSVLSFGLADLTDRKVKSSSTIVLRNHSDSAVDVTLNAEEAPRSAGAVSVTPESGTIAPDGKLEVTVAATAKRTDYDEDVTGWVVAQTEAGGADLRVPYLLALRPLIVQTSPDPSDGTTEAFVGSPVPLADPPIVTVTPQRGRAYEVTATPDHGNWYRAELTGKKAGAYKVAARAQSTTGLGLVGNGSFEVADGRGGPPGPVGWRPIGPNAESGAISTTPADSDTAALTQYVKAGPWTTDDGGKTWEQHNRLPVAGGTGELIIDAVNPKTMWYAINGRTGLGAVLDPTYQGRILRTTDGGDSWTTLDVPDEHILALVSDERTQVLVAATADALLVSRDDGQTWDEHGNVAGDALIDAAVGGDDLYLASSTSVWAVRGLLTGEPHDIEQVFDGSGSFSEGVDGLVANDVVVSILNRKDDVYASYDAGGTWSVVYDVPDGGALDLAMSDDTIMVSTYRDVQHLGSDNGATWTTVPEPLNGAIETDFTRWGEGWWWSSPNAGLFQTDADGNDPQRVGVQGRTVHDLVVSEDDDGVPMLLAGTDADVYRTELPTGRRLAGGVAEWGLSGSEAYVGTRVAQLAVSAHDTQTVWKIRKDALSSFWVYRSTDGGETWEQRGRSFERPFDLAVMPDDPDRVVVPFWSLVGQGLYVTEDSGQSWRKLLHSELFTAVAADPTHPDRLWLGGSSGLYRSDDFGETVEQMTSGRVTTIEVSGDRIVAGGDDIKVSDDGGKTFATADYGDLQMRVSDLLVSGRTADTWYAATQSFAANGLVKGGRGVLRSTDGGQTWVNVSLGLENLSVVSLAASPDGRWLYAGTEQGGVHRVRTR